MQAYAMFSRAVAKCMVFCVATAITITVSGCGGGVSSQITPDEQANARAQAAADRQKKAESKKRLPEMPKAVNKKRPLGL